MHFFGICSQFLILIIPKQLKYIIFFYFTQTSMCFLKKFQRISTIPVSKSQIYDDTDNYSSDESTFTPKKDTSFLQLQQIQNLQKKQNGGEMFMNLFSLLNYNTILMESLEEKINKNNETLDDLKENIAQNAQEIEQEKCSESENTQAVTPIEKLGHFSDQILTQKLFGKKSYKYKLKLTQQFGEIIYKERNISFSVALTTKQGQTVRNSNIIHLCLGVCDNNGQWIAETRNGQNFMKGKTEAQLYHGESNYSKIYPRDVSRSYQNGKVNFVVYPKPSMLYYSGNTSSLESKVNYDEIEPLLIKDLMIRAKKKD